MLHHLLLLWQAYASPIGALLGGLAGWYGKVTANRMQARRDRLDAGEQALHLINVMQVRETQLSTSIAQYSAEIDRLRISRWAIEETLQQIHGAAIAARLMVHDLEGRLGLKPTAFDPLPPFVLSSPPDVASPGPVSKTGAQGVPAP